MRILMRILISVAMMKVTRIVITVMITVREIKLKMIKTAMIIIYSN
jgi:hypothetical protein